MSKQIEVKFHKGDQRTYIGSNLVIKLLYFDLMVCYHTLKR